MDAERPESIPNWILGTRKNFALSTLKVNYEI